MKSLILLFILATTASVGKNTAERATNNVPTVDKFLNSFLSWYVPRAAVEVKAPAWTIVIHDKPNVLSAYLRQKLVRDIIDSNNSMGMIEGLDFDPFFGSQEPCESYHIDGTEREGRKYLTNVAFNCGGKAQQSIVKIEVGLEASHYVITNVIYSANSNLVKTLGEEGASK